MKKRIALGAVIATAIAVTGMFPASAAKLGAPTVVTSSCARAGGTLEAKVSDGDITVSLATGATSLTIAGPSCAADDLVVAGLTSVVLKADDDDATPNVGNVTVVLSDADYVTNFASIPMTIQAENDLVFDGDALTNALKFYTGTVTEETFTIGSVTGSYYAGRLSFKGGAGGDKFDASAVTTTPVLAVGNNGADTFKGGSLADTLTGGNGYDVLYGNGGDDTLNADEGVVVTCNKIQPGGSANAGRCLSSSASAAGADEAWGGAGDDTIAGDGADIVAPGDGMDTVNGNVFQLNYGDSSAAVTLNLTKEAGVVRSTAGDDYYDGFDEFVGSTFADTLVGNGSANALFGLDGADAIVGLAGADVLSGNGGTDAIKGGLGADEIYGDTGADKINGGGDDDVIYMGGGDDIAYGSVGDDVLRGNKGSDQAWGGKGTFDVCAAEVTDSCEYKK